ncbi:UNVERIFIED_CONTAM: hypothetical protein GTU68_002862 [Idotea baltica]|nr:hypothetical protein [Idotea baltica]
MLLEYGAKVIIISRKEILLKEACDELNKFGECKYVVCDIRNTEQIATVVEFIKSEFKHLDFLVNNAGGQFPMFAENITENGWSAVINNNLNGTFFMTKAMANAFFIPQKSGNIVNIIANIFRGFPGMAHTGAARAGVDNLTKSLAVEWCKHNIRINAIAPGIINSSGLDTYEEGVFDFNEIQKTIPMKRLGTNTDVANLVMFLASSLSSYITGETIYVDGGHRLSGDLFKF